jgi:polysaccharide export outer membrane protein
VFYLSRYASKINTVLIIVITLSGCQVLSKEGPTAQDIKSRAAITISGANTRTIFDYVLIDVDGKAVNEFGTPPKTSLARTFGNVRSIAPELKFGVGDIVQLTVFEAQTGGLFIPPDAGARPGNFVTFPSQQIDGAGKLEVPYAGTIKFADRSFAAVQDEIAKKLSNRAIEPQVMITLANQRSSQVSVVGDVRSPSRIDVNPAGDRIIDVLARAGGPASPGYETYVTLERDRSKSTMFFDDILANPRENIYVHPDDTIYLYREAMSFLAFGATNSGSTGASTKIEFGASSVTLAEGIAKTGGLDDTRADAKKVFIYRTVDRTQLTHANIDLRGFERDQGQIPVIFQLDFRNPSAYFAAQNFYLANKDVMYVDNSGSYELSKFLSLVTNVTSTMTSSSNAVTAVHSGRDAIRDFD